MPNIKSAKKRVKTNEKARLRNSAHKSKMRTVLKNFDASIEAGDKDAVQKNLNKAVKALDHTASKGIIHKKTAARKKSRIYKAAAKVK